MIKINFVESSWSKSVLAKSIQTHTYFCVVLVNFPYKIINRIKDFLSKLNKMASIERASKENRRTHRCQQRWHLFPFVGTSHTQIPILLRLRFTNSPLPCSFPISLLLELRHENGVVVTDVLLEEPLWGKTQVQHIDIFIDNPIWVFTVTTGSRNAHTANLC